jgi:hypothetical protein
MVRVGTTRTAVVFLYWQKMITRESMEMRILLLTLLPV